VYVSLPNQLHLIILFIIYLLIGLLETTFTDMEQSKKEFEKLSTQKEVILMKLDAARTQDDSIKVNISNYTINIIIIMDR